MWKFVKEPPKKSGGEGERLHQPRIRDYFTILRYRNVWLCCIGAAGFISWLFLSNVFAPLYITEVAHQKATTAGFSSALPASAVSSWDFSCRRCPIVWGASPSSSPWPRCPR